MAELCELLQPVLAEAQEDEQVRAVVAGILRNGTGARRQRDTYATRQNLRDAAKAVIMLGCPTAAEPRARPGTLRPGSRPP